MVLIFLLICVRLTFNFPHDQTNAITDAFNDVDYAFPGPGKRPFRS